MPKKSTVEGNDLMLFLYDKTDRKYKSIAFATSHSLQINGEVESSILTKDHGSFASKSVKSINWSISSSNLYSDDYDKLFDLMNAKEEITVVWGNKKPEASGKYVADDNDLAYWQPNAQNYKGTAFITSLQVTAQSGERATMEIQLEGSGSFSKVANVTA